jgi:hypothetical protein
VSGTWDGVQDFTPEETGVPAGLSHWDFQIYRLSDGFLDCASFSRGEPSQATELYFGVSSDGKSFAYGGPVIKLNATGLWPDGHVYTTALVPMSFHGVFGFHALVSGRSVSPAKWGLENVDIIDYPWMRPCFGPPQSLYWHEHTSPVSGHPDWGIGERIADCGGWNFQKVFGASNGVFYAIDANYDLLWYKHIGQDSGSTNIIGPVKVNSGWDFEHVFAAANGVIYAINASHELLWYKHIGQDSGSTNIIGPININSGWDFQEVVAADNGVLYSVTSSHDLLWYRHINPDSGSGNILGPVLIDKGWDFTTVFAFRAGAAAGVSYLYGTR